MRKAVPLLINAGDTQQEFVFNNWHVESTAQFDRIVIAILDLAIAFETIGWTLRLEQDGAACRVAAEQRALRPAQYLQAGEVIIIEAATILRIIALIGDDRNLGGIEHHAWGCIESRALATDGHVLAIALLARAADNERRHLSEQVLRV